MKLAFASPDIYMCIYEIEIRRGESDESVGGGIVSIELKVIPR